MDLNPKGLDKYSIPCSGNVMVYKKNFGPDTCVLSLEALMAIDEMIVMGAQADPELLKAS